MIDTAVALPPALEEGVIVWRPEGGVLYANEAAERIIGVPEGALLGAPLDAAVLLSPDGDALSPEQLPAARVTRAGSRVDQEFGFPHADGGTIWVSVRSAPLPDGTIASAFSTIGEAEAKARSAARIATLVDDSPDLVLLFDGRGLIEYVSPSVARSLLQRPDELIGRLWRAIMHPDDVLVLRTALADAGPDEPHTGILALRLRAGDETWRWMEGQATLRYHNGMAVAIELTGRDVTRRRVAEEEGRRLSSQLEALVASAPDGIIMINEQGKIAVINEQACELLELGMPSDEITGADRTVVFDSLRRLLADPEAGIAQLQAVVDADANVRFVALECADGRRISFDHVPLGERGSAGRLWMFRDITRFKLVEQEQREFLATMSHEIKTPLSGIAGAAELLRGADLPERERDLAEVIGDAAQALGGLLRDVLDVQRSEAGRAEPEAADYDLRRLLTSVAGVLRPSLHDRPIELLVEVDAAVPDALFGDAARVRQIVLNLASNAVKYTETGRACIRASVLGERLQITVSDTGPGIEDADLQRLFEPWTRGHGRAWAGTGLGLSIARRLARAMGGDVTALSRLGDGSAFTLELPLLEGKTTPEPVADAPHTLSACHVLIAEDDASLRRLIGMQLDRLGVEATLVEHGQAAVAAAETGGFDAILLDLRMPVMGGIDAALAIRAHEAADGRPPVPILALTADTAAEDVERCRAAGMDGHLSKPVSLPALRAELDRRVTPVLDDELLAELAESLGGQALVNQMLAVYRGGLAERLEHLRDSTDPLTRADAAHALRSPSAGFGVARLAARLRVVEVAARAGTLAELEPVLAAAAQADAVLAARLAG